MLLYNPFHVILVFVVLRTTDSLRKIKDGNNINTSMKYMVYLTKAQQSPTIYDAWICGGAIVTADFIITSAACVEDVQYMYAIAGTKFYVNTRDIANNKCTVASRKKIVFTCVPKSYDFDYAKIQKWAFIDIAAVKVESPYDFTATNPLPGCSWVPDKIEINYDRKRQEPDTDAMVLGWGHTQKWRKPGDTNDYNHETLQYSSILLMDKEQCKALYGSLPKLHPIIDKYMICAMNAGNIDDKGDLITRSKPTADGCVGGALRVGGVCQDPSVQENQKPIPHANPYAYILRQQEQNQKDNSWNAKVNQKNHGFNPYAYINQDPADDNIGFNFRRQDGNMTANTTSYNYTRKAGICQNDHGGPIVTWVGKHEVLLGVASVFRLNQASECVGPYLFTSTQCNGAFLDCVINSNLYDDTKPDTLKVSTFAETEPPLIKLQETNPPHNNPTDTTPSDTDPPDTDSSDTNPPDTNPPDTNPPDTNPAETNPADTNPADTNPADTNPADTNPPVVENPQDPNKNNNETRHLSIYGNEPYFKINVRRASDLCNLPESERSFDVVERRISWRNHPDGPAENELVEDLYERPTLPIQRK